MTAVAFWYIIFAHALLLVALFKSKKLQFIYQFMQLELHLTAISQIFFPLQVK
jgi:hypothetical protein